MSTLREQGSVDWQTGVHAPGHTWAVLNEGVTLALWQAPDQEYPGDVPKNAKRHWRGRVRISHTINGSDGPSNATVEFYVRFGRDLLVAKAGIVRAFRTFAETVANAAQNKIGDDDKSVEKP